MKYRLKPNVENFDVVDGPFAGREYRRGKIYRKEDIPENEMQRFEELGESSAKLIKKMADKNPDEITEGKEEKKKKSKP